MRALPFAFVALLSSLLSVEAQVSIEVLLDQDQFLRDESLPLKVRVTNRSGRTLHLGHDNEWIAFSVESLDGPPVSKQGEVQMTGEFALDSARAATRTIDLIPGYDLSRPGRYRVTASLRSKEWSEETSSKPKAFEIIRGTKLWEREFGIPSTGTQESRKYALQQASYRKQLKLYLRLTDVSENTVFRVFPLGSLVSFSQPEAQLDQFSHLHVLFQTGARSFLFHVINPEGEVVLRQTYDYADTRPMLRSNANGRIYVSGGGRRLTITDVPPSLTSNAGLPPDDPEPAGAASRPAEPGPGKDAAPRKK